jgi:membrane protein
MALNFKAAAGLFKDAGKEWIDDRAPRLGAAVAYYTVFAIPPLLIIILFVASLVFDPSQVRGALFSEAGGLLGNQAAETIESAMAAQQEGNKGTIASIMAAVVLIITATGLFIELQSALNTIWGVETKPGQGIKGFIRNRLLSFATVVGIGFLLLVSLVVSAGVSAVTNYLSSLMPGLQVLSLIATFLVSFAVITLLFAMIFKVLPDVKIAWRDVWVGAAVSSLLFTGGKFVLGMYLGQNTTVSAYGAAGSLIVILLWVYYSAQILFFGAEVTQVYANRYGSNLVPSAHAQWVQPDTTPEAKKQSRHPRPPASRGDELLEELRKEVGHLRAVVAHR